MTRRRLWRLTILGFAATLIACKVYDSSLLPDGPGDPAVGSGGGGTGGSAAGVGGSDRGGSGGRAGSPQGGSGGDGEFGSGGAGGDVAGAAGAGGSGGGTVPDWPSPGVIVINELFFDTPATDAGCFVELKGPPNTNLSGYKLRGINGKQTTPQDFYAEIVFDESHVFNANGYFVIAQDATVFGAGGAAGAGGGFVINAKADLQNGPDNVLLLGPGDVVVDGVGYSGVDGTFELPDVFRGEIATAVSPPDVNKGFSLSRLPDGADVGNNAIDFGLGTRTPGGPNVAAPPP